ncbi:hypothetical protein ACQP10_38340 (plasmid) [Streptosporangium sandarakinum]|uniref:hypothetical protein n=1 Tax=Streptosporangium sandarakinum TaxID=1260955 RepID=UPI003D8C43D5
MHAADLVKAYERADSATRLAADLATIHPGNPGVFPTIALTVTVARDAYTTWADVMGDDSVAAELRELGRIARAWIDTLADEAVRYIANQLGFPIALMAHVSTSSLRFWINPAYPLEHEKKQHITQVAKDRFVHDYGAASLAAALAQSNPVLVALPDGVRPATTFLPTTL